MHPELGSHIRDRLKAIEDAACMSGQTLGAYAERSLGHRRSLTKRTKLLYRRQLDELLPVFGDVPMDQISRAKVREWWSHELPAAHPTRPTGNAHVYALLRTILGHGVEHELLSVNPASIKGAGRTKRQRNVKPATLPQLQTIARAMPEAYRMAVLLAGWCALGAPHL
jgi:hypothetical protein